FKIELKPGYTDYFELDQKGDKVVIRGNSYVNIATGLNWYLKYYAGVHLSWNGMTATLPDPLPRVEKPERHTTDLPLRYDLNYCTYSYTMPFWDWERWEKEIDWMALHGVNLPLAAVGQECVWRNMLLRMGYTSDEVNDFIAGPAFLAWWAMNNLEGWGGPNPDSWYQRQENLQKRILRRMTEYGIKPVFPGYSGMAPHNADEKLGLNLTKIASSWCGFTRPAFLQPTDERYAEIAQLYYDEQKKLFGLADYYSMDPFHELSNTKGVDFDASGKAIMAQMKKANPDAVWVVQGWTENPREEMIRNLNAGDLLVLDLFAECRPMWGIESTWKRENGFLQHDWVMCMLENFGGNVGLHGRMDQLLENFY
ncbi:MAG: alpha-N-acetylglucosaminidase, partial [Muribaculaceae bacterium]|nr:alpha-N-acetylglucosaminidase [Muribaculaceae bacterium]